ncbi:MAG TPA: sulfatase-like hydrolase/transferase, partial [Verrucomicrobiae bacterium]
SVASVTNGKKFSYPGYSEAFTGFADDRIDSNDKKPNPNVTVFEWLQARPGFKNGVAAFASWDVFPYILNCERSRLPIWPAWETRFEDKRIRPPQYVIDTMRDTTTLWPDLILDSFLFHAALDHVKRERPRVMFLGFGETDEWAHEVRYDRYLQSANHVDQFVRQLWQTLQSIPPYRDKTTLIITADHGRGTGPKGWRDHGDKTEGAEHIWLAVLGPDTPALGERANCAPITQSQIAATMAALLGEDYRAAFPKAGAPIADIIGRPVE